MCQEGKMLWRQAEWGVAKKRATNGSAVNVSVFDQQMRINRVEVSI